MGTRGPRLGALRAATVIGALAGTLASIGGATRTASAAPAPEVAAPASSEASPTPRRIATAAAGYGLTRAGADVAADHLSPTRLLVTNGPGAPVTVRAGGLLDERVDDRRAPYGGFTSGASVAACTHGPAGTTLTVTGAGPGGGPNVVVADGQDVLASFFAYDPGFRSGVDVGCADLDGDGVDEIVTGPGPGGGPNVRVFDFRGRLLRSFFAYDTRFTGGVRVSGGRGVIVTGAGAGGGPHVRTFDSEARPVGNSFCSLAETPAPTGVDVGFGDLDADGTPDVVCGPLRGAAFVLDLFFDPATKDLGASRTSAYVPSTPHSAGVRLDATTGIAYVASGPGGPPEVVGLTTRPLPTGPRILASNRLVDPEGAQPTLPLLVAGGASWLAGPERRLVLAAGGSLHTAAVDGSDVRTVLPDATGPVVGSAASPTVAFSEAGASFIGTYNTSDPFRSRSASYDPSQSTGRSARVAISPDGFVLAVVVHRPDASPFVSVASTQVPNQRALTGGTRRETDPAFSPDSRQLAFCSSGELHVMPVGQFADADPAAVERVLTSTGWCEAPSWSPDGSTIAVVTRRSIGTTPSVTDAGATVLLPAAGGPTTDLGPAGTTSWDPAGGRLVLADFSEQRLRVITPGATPTSRDVGPVSGYGASWEPPR